MNEVETAVFEYNEEGPGAYTIMAQRLKNPGPLMRQSGWRDGHIIFYKVDGGIEFGTIYPEEMSRRLTADDDDNLYDLLMALRDGIINIHEVDEKSIGPMGDWSVQEVTGLERA